MKISNQFLWTLVVILTVYGYFQGVVVPQTETKYAQQASVISMDRTPSSGTVKSFPCNPVQTKCGKLVIKKDAVPDSYQDFTFVHQTIPGYVQTFTLDDDATLPNPSTLPNFKAFYTPYNATFSVAEVTNPAFIATVTCVDPSGGTTVNGAIANISIFQGESVTCTFKNVPASTTTACTTSNTWTQRANFGGGLRNEAVGFSIGTRGYLGLGIDDLGNYYQDFWEYNPTTNTWTQKADFAGGLRMGPVGFSIGTKGYVGIGVSGIPLQNQWTNPGNLTSDFWEYNPTTNTWTQKADFAGGLRGVAVGFSIGSKGYIGSGSSVIVNPSVTTIDHNDFWEYNPTTNLWTQKANIPGPRSNSVGFSIGARGYVGAGSSNTSPLPTYYQDFWEYNPTTNLWTQKANFGGGTRISASGFSVGSRGYLGVGYSFTIGNNILTHNDFWEYNPTTNTWTQKANFGGGTRVFSDGFSVGNIGYLGIGRVDPMLGSSVSDFWCYKP